MVCVASIWVPNKLGAAYLLMGGVALSRLGLWMFDLAVIQQMQVSPNEYCLPACLSVEYVVIFFFFLAMYVDRIKFRNLIVVLLEVFKTLYSLCWT